jgi:hypothetical protein
MRLKAGTTIIVNHKRYTVTGQRGGFVVCVREGERPDDVNYHAFSVDALARSVRRWHELKESWSHAVEA